MQPNRLTNYGIWSIFHSDGFFLADRTNARRSFENHVPLWYQVRTLEKEQKIKIKKNKNKNVLD